MPTMERKKSWYVVLVRVHSVADEIIPPFGLGYLAEAIRRAGHRVTIVDALREGLREQDLVARLRSLDPDLAGFLLFSKDLSVLRPLLRSVRAALPRTLTIVGGPHPSAVPEETLSHFGEPLDFAFAGEAESPFPLFLERMDGTGHPDFSGVPGLVWRTPEGIRANGRQIEPDLDSLQVAWDLIPTDRYPRAPHGAYYRQFPIAPIITSRGCPFLCTFCSAERVSGRRMRRCSVESVIEKIERLHRIYGVREIHIEDDNFTGQKEFVLAFCEALRRKVPGISWACPNGVRLDLLDREMLRAMKEAGLYFLSVGVESGSNRVLRLMKKSLTVERIEEKVRLIHEAGIGVAGFFMLGFPGETVEEMRETIRFAKRLPLSRASFANFSRFPAARSSTGSGRTGTNPSTGTGSSPPSSPPPTTRKGSRRRNCASFGNRRSWSST